MIIWGSECHKNIPSDSNVYVQYNWAENSSIDLFLQNK